MPWPLYLWRKSPQYQLHRRLVGLRAEEISILFVGFNKFDLVGP
jgi:hypothetical protein